MSELGFKQWIGSTIFIEVNEDDIYVYMPGMTSEAANKPRGLAVPSTPTAIERSLHQMTHLPFRSWCLVCLKAKSKSDQHRRLKLKEPLIQVDFAFWVDSTGFSLPILTAVGVQSSLASASALPSKEISRYAITELKRFVYECGSTFGNIQCGQENCIIGIVKAVVREVGGLKFRLATKGKSQTQAHIVFKHKQT